MTSQCHHWWDNPRGSHPSQHDEPSKERSGKDVTSHPQRATGDSQDPKVPGFSLSLRNLPDTAAFPLSDSGEVQFNKIWRGNRPSSLHVLPREMGQL